MVFSSLWRICLLVLALVVLLKTVLPEDDIEDQRLETALIVTQFHTYVSVLEVANPVVISPNHGELT